MRTTCSLLDRLLNRLKFGLLVGLLLGVLLPTWTQAAIILASLGNNTVHKFDSVTGADLGVFASGFTSVSGIGFQPANAGNGFVGSVYIADYSADTVTKYTTGGSLVEAFGSGFDGPEAMTVDAFGNVYVSNYEGFNVKKFGPAGNLLTTISTGSGRPEGLGFATNGDLLVNIYTGGVNSGTIGRYSNSSFALLGNFASDLTNNLPLAVDNAGNVYIGELAGNTRLRKYSSNGTLLGSITLSDGVGIYGLAINELGDLLVGANGSDIRRYSLDLVSQDTFATPPSSPRHMALIPEPSSTLLLGMGIVGLIIRRRR